MCKTRRARAFRLSNLLRNAFTGTKAVYSWGATSAAATATVIGQIAITPVGG